jgi:uncharacterized Zn finger protein
MRKILIRLLKVKHDRTCPQCGSRMMRVHRRISDRLLNRIVPVIRCSCCGKSYRVLSDSYDELRFTMF